MNSTSIPLKKVPFCLISLGFCSKWKIQGQAWFQQVWVGFNLILVQFLEFIHRESLKKKLGFFWPGCMKSSSEQIPPATKERGTSSVTRRLWAMDPEKTNILKRSLLDCCGRSRADSTWSPPPLTQWTGYRLLVPHYKVLKNNNNVACEHIHSHSHIHSKQITVFTRYSAW